MILENKVPQNIFLDLKDPDRSARFGEIALQNRILRIYESSSNLMIPHYMTMMIMIMIMIMKDDKDKLNLRS